MTSDIYEKYTYRIRWSEEDDCYIGTCLELPSLSTCEQTPEEAFKEIRMVAQEALSWLEEESKPIPMAIGTKKYSGKLTIRIPEEIHREIALKSAEEGVSINKYILSKISSI